jgi:hypothetical protein
MAASQSYPSSPITLAQKRALLARLRRIYPELVVHGRRSRDGFVVTVALDERWTLPGHADLIHVRFLVAGSTGGA